MKTVSLIEGIAEWCMFRAKAQRIMGNSFPQAKAWGCSYIVTKVFLYE
jgi:hypothetical protein